MKQFLLTLLVLIILQLTECGYTQIRNDFINTEKSKAIGGNIFLNEKEVLVNKILMRLKTAELNITTPKDFLPSRHFFEVRNSIEASKVFKLLKILPKGANLHSHITSLLSIEKFIDMIYGDVYICIKGEAFILTFVKNMERCDVIDQAKNMDVKYKKSFKAYLSLYYNVDNDLSDVSVLFQRFGIAFYGAQNLLSNDRFFKDFFYAALLELYQDNVMYLEFRAEISDENTGKISDFSMPKLCENVIDQFLMDYPEFLGAKMIFTPTVQSQNTMDDLLMLSLKLKKEYPDLIAGFDLWGHSSTLLPKGNQLTSLLKLRNVTDFYTNAGETIWYGTQEDLTVIDAILLGSKRIAHGFSLYKHPEAAKLAKDLDIAFEISPIYTQVFSYLKDMRNHPASFLVANDYPLVITNDYPMILGTKGLSYDWYMAFMAISSLDADLRFLKQLAINSIEYSAYGNKTFAMEAWSRKWDVFLDVVLRDFK